MATQTKPKTTSTKKKEEPTLDEQIELLDAPKAVDRVLKNPITEEERTYVQHEMGFMTKLKFFRLFSGTLRLASQSEVGGVSQFVESAIQGGINPETFIETLMKLVELAPDFIEEAYMLILKVPLDEQVWATEALDSLSDEEGVDILDVFIAQNAEALNAFFTKHLKKLQTRATSEFGNLLNEDTEQESETTT